MNQSGFLGAFRIDLFPRYYSLLHDVTIAKLQAYVLNPLSANFTKWSNTLKQFVGNLPTNCLSLFDHFVKLVLKGLMGDYLAFR